MGQANAWRKSAASFIRISAAVLLLSALLYAQLLGGRKGESGKNPEDVSAPRHLVGTVFNSAGRAVPGAIVYLKNKRNLSIYTYITGDNGSYRFNNLSPDIDYEVSAESNGHKSAAKTLSSFDSRKQPRINLKLGK